MNEAQTKLVQDSWKKVAPRSGEAADVFYNRLFEIAPETRSMFCDDLAEQKKKLMQTLGVLVNGLATIEEVLPAVRELGTRHAALGVTAAQFDYVGAALIHMFDIMLADEMNADIKAAWVAVYSAVAAEMIAAIEAENAPAA